MAAMYQLAGFSDDGILAHRLWYTSLLAFVRRVFSITRQFIRVKPKDRKK